MPIVDCEYDVLDRCPDGWLRAYHGTGTAEITRFLPSWGDLGPHFGTPLAANRRAEHAYKYPPFDPTVPSMVWDSPEAEAERLLRTYMNGVLFAVDLNIRNPIRVRDDCDVVPNFMNWYPSSVAKRAGVGDPSIMHAAETRQDYERARRLFIEAAEALGHDGVVYANESEGRGGDSLIPFRSEQIRFRFQLASADAE